MGGETPSRRASLRLSQPGFGQEGDFTVCFQVHWNSPFIRCAGLCPHLICQAAFSQIGKMEYKFYFLCPRDKCISFKAGGCKKSPVCWLPFRKPITWKNSRNAIAHLKNSNTDIKCSASSPLTHKMPWEDRREVRRIRAALQVTTHWRDAQISYSNQQSFYS